MAARGIHTHLTIIFVNTNVVELQLVLCEKNRRISIVLIVVNYYITSITRTFVTLLTYMQFVKYGDTETNDGRVRLIFCFIHSKKVASY